MNLYSTGWWSLSSIRSSGWLETFDDWSLELNRSRLISYIRNRHADAALPRLIFLFVLIYCCRVASKTFLSCSSVKLRRDRMYNPIHRLYHSSSLTRCRNRPNKSIIFCLCSSRAILRFRQKDRITFGCLLLFFLLPLRRSRSLTHTWNKIYAIFGLAHVIGFVILDDISVFVLLLRTLSNNSSSETILTWNGGNWVGFSFGYGWSWFFAEKCVFVVYLRADCVNATCWSARSGCFFVRKFNHFLFNDSLVFIYQYFGHFLELIVFAHLIYA